MATKPSESIPTWATDAGADVTDPGSAKRAAGWLLGEAPAHDHVNFLDNVRGAWAAYFEQAIDELVAEKTNIDQGLAGGVPSPVFEFNVGGSFVYRVYVTALGLTFARDVTLDAGGWVSDGPNPEVIEIGTSPLFDLTIRREYGALASGAFEHRHTISKSLVFQGVLGVGDGSNPTITVDGNRYSNFSGVPSTVSSFLDWSFNQDIANPGSAVIHLDCSETTYKWTGVVQAGGIRLRATEMSTGAVVSFGSGGLTVPDTVYITVEADEYA